MEGDSWVGLLCKGAVKTRTAELGPSEAQLVPEGDSRCRVVRAQTQFFPPWTTWCYRAQQDTAHRHLPSRAQPWVGPCSQSHTSCFWVSLDPPIRISQPPGPSGSGGFLWSLVFSLIPPDHVSLSSVTRSWSLKHRRDEQYLGAMLGPVVSSPPPAPYRNRSGQPAAWGACGSGEETPHEKATVFMDV